MAEEFKETASGFEVKASFKMVEKDKKLYEKYGAPAIELAVEGEFSAAVKLLDKVLKESPKAEFALLLKANYLFSQAHKELTLETEVHNGDAVKFIENNEKELIKMKQKMEECITLLDEVLELNPKNENAKKMQEYIKKFLLKNVLNVLEQVKKKKGDIEKVKTTGMSVNFRCPYCNNTDDVFRITKSEGECLCSKCKKTFFAIVGTARGARGLGGYVAQTAVIRLLKLEGGEMTVSYYSTHQGTDIRSGDEIALIFKKGFLSNKYDGKPTFLINWTNKTYSKSL